FTINFLVFLFTDTSTIYIYSFSLHDALPICIHSHSLRSLHDTSNGSFHHCYRPTGGHPPVLRGPSRTRSRPPATIPSGWPVAVCRLPSHAACHFSGTDARRSEEHTSELQSRENL